ncbi:uncharacterized protein [Spinacia oleracea]|uniref:Uncharacterized protein isoform X2 n=1 Tax=Spinacia oleracea TaxID=3562 RepID=A0ABM3RGX1_SPIOL|nr:uncharacterized protein LOC110789089 isoform X2 [Spinacia oleracea]
MDSEPFEKRAVSVYAIAAVLRDLCIAEMSTLDDSFVGLLQLAFEVWHSSGGVFVHLPNSYPWREVWYTNMKWLF